MKVEMADSDVASAIRDVGRGLFAVSNSLTLIAKAMVAGQNQNSIGPVGLLQDAIREQELHRI
jgi:hypothetical protein